MNERRYHLIIEGRSHGYFRNRQSLQLYEDAVATPNQYIQIYYNDQLSDEYRHPQIGVKP